MSVRYGLEHTRDILVKLSERPDCGELTGYDKMAINCFVEDLDRAIKRYKSEAARTWIEL